MVLYAELEYKPSFSMSLCHRERRAERSLSRGGASAYNQVSAEGTDCPETCSLLPTCDTQDTACGTFEPPFTIYWPLAYCSLVELVLFYPYKGFYGSRYTQVRLPSNVQLKPLLTIVHLAEEQRTQRHFFPRFEVPYWYANNNTLACEWKTIFCWLDV